MCCFCKNKDRKRYKERRKILITASTAPSWTQNTKRFQLLMLLNWLNLRKNLLFLNFHASKCVWFQIQLHVKHCSSVNQVVFTQRHYKQPWARVWPVQPPARWVHSQLPLTSTFNLPYNCSLQANCCRRYRGDGTRHRRSKQHGDYSVCRSHFMTP